MKILVDKIVERYGTNIHWSLTGGELTLNPDQKTPRIFAGQEAPTSVYEWFQGH